MSEHEILHHIGPAWLMALELLFLTHYFIRDWLAERDGFFRERQERRLP
jgi:hypothetical protein